jgi:hypothetical protein
VDLDVMIEWEMGFCIKGLIVPLEPVKNYNSPNYGYIPVRRNVSSIFQGVKGPNIQWDI